VNEWGQLFSWGCNLNGQLGNIFIFFFLIFILRVLFSGYCKYNNHIYYVCPTGLNSVDCTERVPRMVKVLGTNVIVQIACGVEHSIALTNDGELYAWGSNKEGQLGLGSHTLTEIKPKRISALAAVPIAFIACGGYHTIVISKSGKCLYCGYRSTLCERPCIRCFLAGAVFSWGRNTFGQLGLNDIQQRNLPCQLRTLRNARVCYATCGEEFSVFLTMVNFINTLNSEN